MRGEQSAVMMLILTCQGSPPLARGTVARLLLSVMPMRITPACAGNRYRLANSLPWAEDHPRLRGEQVFGRFDRCCYQGSPPLARGTEPCERLMQGLKRITPACAGNSRPLWTHLPPRQDHPRLRGEQQNNGKNDHKDIGSPPLARGTVSSLSRIAR